MLLSRQRRRRNNFVLRRDFIVGLTAAGVVFLLPPSLDAQSGSGSVLAPAVDAARQLPRIHSLLVSQRGVVILERDFNGRRETTPANVKSVSKSVISALVGIAADRKLLALDQPISKYFSDLPETKRTITIEHLLTMQSGLESTSNRNYGSWVQSPNWVRYALARPLLAAPGSRMIYSTGNTHVLSATLTKATGKSTWHFAQEVLATPLDSRCLNGRAIRRASISVATR